MWDKSVEGQEQDQYILHEINNEYIKIFLKRGKIKVPILRIHGPDLLHDWVTWYSD